MIIFICFCESKPPIFTLIEIRKPNQIDNVCIFLKARNGISG